MAHAHLVGPFPSGVVPEEYDRVRRQVLWKLPMGLYLLGSRSGERRNLMTCNWVGQVGVEPKLLATSVEQGVHTHELVRAGGSFTVNLLARADRALARKFVKPATDDRAQRTLNGIAYHDARVSGGPVVDAAIGYLDCSVVREVDCGSHSLFVGEVVDAGYRAESAETFEDLEILRMEDTRMSYGG